MTHLTSEAALKAIRRLGSEFRLRTISEYGQMTEADPADPGLRHYHEGAAEAYEGAAGLVEKLVEEIIAIDEVAAQKILGCVWGWLKERNNVAFDEMEHCDSEYFTRWATIHGLTGELQSYIASLFPKKAGGAVVH